MFMQHCPRSRRFTAHGLACGLFSILAAVCHGADRHPIQLLLKPYAGTDLRTIDVDVSGRTTPFIFDTGAGFTVLTPDEIKLAGCAPFGAITAFRADGGRITNPRCGPVTLEIDHYRVRREVTVFDLNRLLGKGVPPVGGLVGLASFDGRAITLDLAHDRVTVETAGSLARRIRHMRPIRVRFARGAGGDVDPFIEVRANAGTLWLEVASGNNGPVFLAPHAQQQLGISLPKHGAQAYDLDVIGLGPVAVRVASRDMIYDGQLDPAFLKQVLLTLDIQHGSAWASRDVSAAHSLASR